MKTEYPRVSLGELLRLERRRVTVRAEKQYEEIGIYCFGRGIFHKMPRTGFEVGDKDLFLLKEGDFILQVTFAWEGAVAIVSAAEAGMYGSTRYPTFRVNEAQCVPRFLLNYFKTGEGLQQLVKICPGSAGRNRVLSIKRIPEVLVPLPPLSEQRRIVERIEELAGQINEARGLRQHAEVEADAVAHASAGALFAEIREQPSPLNQWLNAKREGIQTGPFGAQLSSAEFTEVGTPVLTIGNIQYSGLRLNNLKFVSPGKADKLLRYRVCENDILFARMGTVGRCCVVPKEADGWLINYHIIRVALDTSRVDPRFIHWTIRTSPDVESYLDNKIRGATREGVNSKIVGSLPCRVPPLLEQRRIVAYLDGLQRQTDALKALQAETSAELDALMPSILDKAFRGEL